jgi:hypothetical protein
MPSALIAKHSERQRTKRGGPTAKKAVLTLPPTGSPRLDYASEFEAPIEILEDLISLAIEEIGNGAGREMAVLLSAMRYIDDLKVINQELMRAEARRPKS